LKRLLYPWDRKGPRSSPTPWQIHDDDDDDDDDDDGEVTCLKEMVTILITLCTVYTKATQSSWCGTRSFCKLFLRAVSQKFYGCKVEYNHKSRSHIFTSSSLNSGNKTRRDLFTNLNKQFSA
jgi:hypothetical protein